MRATKARPREIECLLWIKLLSYTSTRAFTRKAIAKHDWLSSDWIEVAKYFAHFFSIRDKPHRLVNKSVEGSRQVPVFCPGAFLSLFAVISNWSDRPHAAGRELRLWCFSISILPLLNWCHVINRSFVKSRHDEKENGPREPGNLEASIILLVTDKMSTTQSIMKVRWVIMSDKRSLCRLQSSTRRAICTEWLLKV